MPSTRERSNSLHKGTWKAGERKTARAFGAERQIGSGSLGRADRSRSDSTHEKIFIECKHAKRHAVITLWDQTKKYAKKENKIPLVVLRVKGRPGSWYLIKDSYLQEIASEHRLSGTVGISGVGSGDAEEASGGALASTEKIVPKS